MTESRSLRKQTILASTKHEAHKPRKSFFCTSNPPITHSFPQSSLFRNQMKT